MGGRYALHVALRHPGLVRRLVLVSATGGMDDPDDRAARRQADEALAVKVETEGVAAFVAWWLQRPLFATLPPRRPPSTAGSGERPRAWPPACGWPGPGPRSRSGPELARLEMPVLVVAGSEDGAYLGHGRRLAAGIGSNATLAVVPGAGHACHLERPDAFLDDHPAVPGRAPEPARSAGPPT